MIPLSIKSRLLGLVLEEKVKHVRDTEYWKLPYGTPLGGHVTDYMAPVAGARAMKMKDVHDEEHVEKLAKRFRENGYDAPPVQIEKFRDGSQVVTDGNHRVEAAHRAGLNRIPVRIYDATEEGAELARRALLDAERAKDEQKAGHVRDTEYWQMPYGTPIVSGMKPGGKINPPSKPKKPTKVQKPKAPKHSAAGSRAAALDDTFEAVETQKTPVVAKVHPPYPEGADPSYRKVYEGRTRIPPRNQGDYQGMTAQEMWDDWADDRKRFVDTSNRADKKTAKAVVDYTGSEYEYMNGLGRGDDVAIADLSSSEVKETRQQIKDMDRAMRPVGKNIMSYRTSTAPVFQELGVGSQFRDGGYTSTTVLEGYLDEVENDLYGNKAGLTYMQIRVPASQKATYVTAFQPRRDRNADIGEAELVLARGTEFRVVEKQGNTLILEIVPPGSDESTPWDDPLDDYTQTMYEQKLAEEEDEDW